MGNAGGLSAFTLNPLVLVSFFGEISLNNWSKRLIERLVEVFSRKIELYIGIVTLYEKRAIRVIF